MKKTYENPMLQVVSVKKCDIVCTSPYAAFDPNSEVSGEVNIGAAGRRGVFDTWYEGY